MRPGAAGGGARRLGYLPDSALAALYGGASAFTLPSLYEGFGLPCLEAMACGAPVVTTRRGALPETCGDAALYVDPGDVAAFVDACVAAASDPAVRGPLIAAGRERASGFAWEKTAAAVDAAIADLLSER
jgi:glycosyltransferase involved in cell wall biosynthesis